MNKPRRAHLVSCTKQQVPILNATLDKGPQKTQLLWVAKDSAGRSFADSTKEGAEKMLTEYNTPS